MKVCHRCGVDSTDGWVLKLVQTPDHWREAINDIVPESAEDDVVAPEQILLCKPCEKDSRAPETPWL